MTFADVHVAMRPASLPYLVLCSLCEFVSNPHAVDLLCDLQKFVVKEFKAITKVNQRHCVEISLLKPKLTF